MPVMETDYKDEDARKYSTASLKPNRLGSARISSPVHPAMKGNLTSFVGWKERTFLRFR
jgi:hypothetical protein